MNQVTQTRPRVGIPYRTTKEQETGENKANLENYFRAVREAGGDPVPVPLNSAQERDRLLPTLDAFVLPGSPSDVDPARYGSVNRGKSEPPDVNREQTDFAILEHALAEKKPVLAICYGCQSLNVYLGGSLIQDIWNNIEGPLRHRKKDPQSSNAENTVAGDSLHPATFERASRLAGLASAATSQINSSHHQAIETPGKNLRVTAHAPDGVIEGVEWTGDSNWVLGVQWHPERMHGDRFAERLFEDFVAAARAARSVAHKT